jgi:hypothetical protein
MTAATTLSLFFVGVFDSEIIFINLRDRFLEDDIKEQGFGGVIAHAAGIRQDDPFLNRRKGFPPHLLSWFSDKNLCQSRLDEFLPLRFGKWSRFATPIAGSCWIEELILIFQAFFLLAILVKVM